MRRREINVPPGTMVTIHYEPLKRENPTGKKRVAAYCRVSTLDEEQVLSFDTQRTYYENLIARHSDMILVKVYGDLGKTGLHTDHRDEFNQMVRDALDGKIDVIMVKSISRFSRNSVECLSILRKFKEKGIQVIFEKEGLDTLDPKTEMVFSILLSLAQNESANISENVRWAFEYRNKSGWPCRVAPYGYRSMRQLKMSGAEQNVDTESAPKYGWVIEPNEAERVKIMFSMASQGFSISRIVQALNTLEEQKGTGYKWNNEHVVNLLRNEAYKGDVLTNKSIQPDYLIKKRRKNRGQADQYYISDHHPPIVEPSVYERVQELLKNGVLFANKISLRKAYMAAHPEVELVGAEMHGAKRSKR